MSNKEFLFEGKYPSTFTQNELNNNSNLGFNQNDNELSELNNQMTVLSLGSESKYRKESTPLPPNPITATMLSSQPDLNLKAEPETETRSTPFMHKMSEGSINDISNKNAFFNPLQGNMSNSSKILKPSGNNIDKYLSSVNYLSNSQTSPICSYYDSSRRYFSHSLQKETQNEELDSIPESQNFIKKSSIEDDMEPNSYQHQDLDDNDNLFNINNENEESNGHGEYMNQAPQGFNQNYLDMKYNFFNPNSQQQQQQQQQQTQEPPQINPSLLPNYGLSHQNLFRPNQQQQQQLNNPNKTSKGRNNAFDFGAYNMMSSHNNNNNLNDEEEGNDNLNENENDNNHHSSQENSIGSLHSDDYIFEKYGKKGWMCEKCNNFNFENRKNCNRCGITKQPKLLSKMKEKSQNTFPNPFKMTQENKIQLPMGEDKKRKPFTERKGDWRCSKCHNLNFAFRKICNMCQLPQYQSEGMNLMKPKGMGDSSFPQPQPQIPMQILNQYQMQLQPQIPYQLQQQQQPRMQQNQVNPFYQNMLNNQINIYNNYYSMMHQNMLNNKKQSQFNQQQHQYQQ